MQVEIIYALPAEQALKSLTVNEGCTVEQAIIESGILLQYPELELNNLVVGIFSKLVDLQHVLQEGDRVEIYRELIIDPMEARRLRAKV